MNLSMRDERLVTIAQLETFCRASSQICFVGATMKEKYLWLERLLTRFFYQSERKKNKHVIKMYALKMSGYSDAQITRLISEFVSTKHIRVPTLINRSTFTTRYTVSDVALLIETDNAHGRLSGPATKEIFRRGFEVFHDQRFERLKNISVAHLYNLRGKRQYTSHSTTYTKTSAVKRDVGERRKPRPEGKPGFIRVDSVHQGDQDKEKGVYHVNLVDEVTQWEIVCCVSGISESFFLLALKEALESFPFVVYGFHSDNGSEYINHRVANMLNKMLIDQTKSRSRHSNDNALAESKNGGVIRKNMGYAHIPKQHARAINQFYKTYFNDYLNFHRPSGYARTIMNSKGKERKIYDLYETPYAHLKKISGTEILLKPGTTFEQLDHLALTTDDNSCAKVMQTAKIALFKTFRY